MRLRGAQYLFMVMGAQGPMHHAAAETMLHVTPHSFVSLKQKPQKLKFDLVHHLLQSVAPSFHL